MSFSALRLPPEMARDSLLAPKYRTEGYLEALDRETLWYDAVWRAGTLHLVCPPLGRWRGALRRARFRGDGVPLKVLRLRRYKRHEVLELAAPARPERLSVYLEGWRGESAVSPATPERFAGRNAMFYVSRDNDLRWLVDHARFHRALHGAEALIVMDNGSESYDRAEIAAALAPTGLDVLVLDAPFKYGPVGKPPYRRLEKFMQTALFNVLRLRYLGAARAILSCDVDELVLTEGGAIFDAARASRLGFVQIAGRWHSPPPGVEGPVRHADHLRVKDPPETCPPKWCLRPDGPLGGWSWDVHGIERLPLLHARTVPGFRFAHCRGVSTGWKKRGRLSAWEGTVEDPLAKACFAQAFGWPG